MTNLKYCLIFSKGDKHMRDFIINNNSFDCDNCTICTCENGKICDNCSKCLGIDGYESRAIKIDEVVENAEEASLKFDLGDFSDFDMEDTDLEGNMSSLDTNDAEADELPYIDALDEGNWEYLEDIEGMEEILHENNSSNILVEQFPGLYVINTKKEN